MVTWCGLSGHSVIFPVSDSVTVIVVSLYYTNSNLTGTWWSFTTFVQQLEAKRQPASSSEPTACSDRGLQSDRILPNAQMIVVPKYLLSVFLEDQFKETAQLLQFLQVEDQRDPQLDMYFSRKGILCLPMNGWLCIMLDVAISFLFG